MRIVHVVPTGEQPWSGVMTVLVELTCALSRRGHDVELWQLHDWDGSYAQQLAALRRNDVSVQRVELPSAPWRIPAVAARTAARRGADVLHLHSLFISANSLIARGVRGPYAVSPHGACHPVSLRRSRRRKQLYRLALERGTLRGAALVCALTDVEARHVRRFTGDVPAVVIPNGVSRPPPDVDAAAFRRQLGLAGDVPLAVFVGRLDILHKGLDLLLRGVAQAHDWHLALIGPDYRNGLRLLQALARELNAEHRVHFVGYRSGMALHQALAAANIFTLTSRWEGMPIALLEALSHGTPALVTPPVEETVSVAAAGAGWLAGENDVGFVLRQVAALEASQMKARSEAARALASSHDWDAVASRQEAAYARVLGTTR